MIEPCDIPKISCLLVTAAGRLERLRLSYRCYLNQTWPNRELVIVNDGPFEYQREISELVRGRDDVRCVFLQGQQYTLGALRNISIDLCYGDVFVQWDDDDFCAPDRLAIQFAYLLKMGAKVCFLTDQLHYYFATRQLYWTNWWLHHSGEHKRYGHIPGTIMAWRKDFGYRYPAAGDHCRAGEDSVMTHDMCLEMPDKIALLQELGYMHMYSFHGKNVWDVEHHMKISKVRGMDCKYLLEHRSRIARTLNFLGFDEVSVVGSDGLAFIHRGGHA